MDWNQLKKRYEALLAPSLQARVKVHATLYRKPATTDGRAWITVDGEQIHSMGDVASDADHRRRAEMTARMEAASPDVSPLELIRQPEQFFSHWDFREALRECVDSGMDDLLESQWPLTRALAMLDRRLGKRRFVRLADVENEHPLVQRLYHLRAQAEGWPVARNVAGDEDGPR
ncbi:MAG TPA: hypothetical protein VFS20_08875 [Longimicrobium sp.]|nr:hypothetical protein [Longimicrobium sp.]